MVGTDCSVEEGGRDIAIDRRHPLELCELSTGKWVGGVCSCGASLEQFDAVSSVELGWLAGSLRAGVGLWLSVLWHAQLGDVSIAEGGSYILIVECGHLLSLAKQ